MKYPVHLKSTAAAIALFIAAPAAAEDFNIPAGDLAGALNSYATRTGVQLIYADTAVRGIQTKGVHGDISPDTALTRILTGTGFSIHRRPTGSIAIVPDGQSSLDEPMQLAQAAPVRATSVETVTVTSSKLGGADVQSVPIAITALSQEQLTATQTAGGPDLVKQVPNLTFSKTNFTGYNIQIRGIGTQAISVTTDPAVAVAFNDIPFIRNHFFEQEFYDVSTGRSAARARKARFMAAMRRQAWSIWFLPSRPINTKRMASVDVGNYNNRRLEGMLNMPIVGDKLDLRVAGEWTKRDGYAFNEENRRAASMAAICGRAACRFLFSPVENLTANFIWEHFSEDDDRARSTKQLCTQRSWRPPSVDGPAGPHARRFDNFGRSALDAGLSAGFALCTDRI